MLKYVGNGWIHGVPARDLSGEEVRKYGKQRLLDSGLYIEIKDKTAHSEVKHGKQGITQDSVGR